MTMRWNSLVGRGPTIPVDHEDTGSSVSFSPNPNPDYLTTVEFWLGYPFLQPTLMSKRGKVGFICPTGIADPDQVIQSKLPSQVLCLQGEIARMLNPNHDRNAAEMADFVAVSERNSL